MYDPASVKLGQLVNFGFIAKRRYDVTINNFENCHHFSSVHNKDWLMFYKFTPCVRNLVVWCSYYRRPVLYVYILIKNATKAKLEGFAWSHQNMKEL